MKLSLVCIERPVFATVLSLLLMILGIMGYQHLETRYFPRIHQPKAQVSVSYSGASPRLMEHDVTLPLENALGNVEGLKEMTSSSGYGSSSISLTFNSDVNMIKAMGDVRDAVSGTIQNLPSDASTPSVSSGGVEGPDVNVGFMDPNLTPSQINLYVQEKIIPPLNTLPGMGGLWTYGVSGTALRIWLEPKKMAALNITVTDVESALNNNNLDFSGGSIAGQNRDYSFVSHTRLSTPQEFGHLIIRDQDNHIIRLKDIAHIAFGGRELQNAPMRINGMTAIDLEIRPLDSANPITLAQASLKMLATLEKTLPVGMTLKVIYNQSTFLLHAIDESFLTLLLAIVLVMGVVYLFLGSLRGALIPIVTIPVCIVGVFGVMALLGYSINVMTLLALILGVGLVVDDAIVVLENVHRHIESGKSPLHAAKRGIHEISFPIIAMTLTLAAVYAPIGLMHGFTAVVFREFAFTLAGAVLISGFVALTLSPMMCSRILKPCGHLGPFEGVLERSFQKLGNGYQTLLNQVLKPAGRAGLILILLILGGAGYWLYKALPQTFIPKEDIGYFDANINGPPGASVGYMDANMRALEKIYAKTPEILSYASFMFSGSAVNFVTMQPWGSHRHVSTSVVLNHLLDQMRNIPGVNVVASIPNPIDYGEGEDASPVQINIMTLQSYRDLHQSVQALEKRLRDYPGLLDIDSNLKFNDTAYQLDFQRDRAAAMGVSLQDIASTISTLMSGSHITDIQQGEVSHDVMVQMEMKDLSSFSGLNDIYVHGHDDSMVPLSNLVTVTPRVQQSSLFRLNQMNAVQVTANIAPGYSDSEVLHYLKGVLSTTLPHDDSVMFTGPLSQYLHSRGTMEELFLLALIFIYLVLAAQFESFVDPFIIILSVPLSIVGAMATLKWTGGSLNLYTEIGLITLVGLITKHGILITQFANARLAEGESLKQAIVAASSIRLRPILMTTSAMVLGALPLALSRGPGSIAHSEIGWVIVGGMMFGTFFSLFVVPVAYCLLAPLDHKKRKLRAGDSKC